MIDLKVTLDRDDALKFLHAFGSQIDFATSLSINNTLNDIQKVERMHVRDKFMLRRAEFVERTIYIGPADRAKKDRLIGTIRIHPERDFLAKFEEDTEKRPRDGGSLAVPVFRQQSPNTIVTRGDPLYFKKLMAAANSTNRIRRRRGETGTPRKRVYLHEARDGKRYLIEATGSTSRVLYSLEPSVPIQPVLRFKENAMATALRMWPQRAAEAIDHAIQTAR